MRTFIVFLFLCSALFAKQVRVAIIDTGIDVHHPKLTKYICKGKDGKLLGLNTLDKNPFPVDIQGHGTHMAGIIVNQIETISPARVCIIPIKLYTDVFKNAGHWTRAKNAFAYAINNRADIINFSVAGVGENYVEKIIIKKLEQKGILLVVAAGNEGDDLSEICNSYPACYNYKKTRFDNMLVVGNLSNHNVCSRSSNYNGPVDVYDYGTKIRSTFLAGNYSILSGTSMSTAKLSGLAAYHKVKRGFPSYKELKNYLIKISVKNCRRPVVRKIRKEK